ncbi:MAG: DedA family protein [Phycisphaerales bacterium]
MQQFLELFTNLPQFLDGFIADHGPWVYALLFLIVFAETGLVVAPFLPGDSLLFTAGAIAARNPQHMNVWLVAAMLVVAGVLGDAVNYHIGRWIGPRVFRYDPGAGAAPTMLERVLNRRHLDRAHGFYERYGGKAVVLGRFIPIVRTFVPFVAGAGAMRYRTFVLYNVAGAIAWVGVCVGAGFLFGNIPFVTRHFEAVIVGIIVVSVLPMVVEVVLAKRRAATASSGPPPRRG